ncbi:hypothetical protein OGZ01_09790 [Vibrio harveyi]|nr:hypothetical protein [Vibrio harveyi]
MRYQSPPSDHTEQAQQSVQERAEQQRIARREELKKVTQADNKRWAANRERVLAERNNENTDVALTPLKEKKKEWSQFIVVCKTEFFQTTDQDSCLLLGQYKSRKWRGQCYSKC